MGGQPGRIPTRVSSVAEDRTSLQYSFRSSSARTQVVIFGDSWAEDNLHASTGHFAGVQGWPVHLADVWHLPIAGNFAKGQSESSSLPRQLEAAVLALGQDMPWRHTVVVLHSGGNDFIGAEKDYNLFAQGNFWLAYCTWGFQRRTLEVMDNLHHFLESLYDLGCRRFLVSELPLTSAIPVLSIARIARVNKRGQLARTFLKSMLEEFVKQHVRHDEGELEVAIAPEVEILNQLVAAAGRHVRPLFLKDFFHPTQAMHRQLAEAVASRVAWESPDVLVGRTSMRALAEAEMPMATAG